MSTHHTQTSATVDSPVSVLTAECTGAMGGGGGGAGGGVKRQQRN